jgi:hypothetical protein
MTTKKEGTRKGALKKTAIAAVREVPKLSGSIRQMDRGYMYSAEIISVCVQDEGDSHGLRAASLRQVGY